MIKKFGIILITTLALTLNVNASSDGELLLKNKPSEVKDCFESVNRATFAFNQTLDGIIFKPIFLEKVFITCLASFSRNKPLSTNTQVSCFPIAR